MTNEDIIRQFPYVLLMKDIPDLLDLLDLARQDEREKLTEEKIREYFAGLNNKETALIVLNYLLRGGVTDDDLRGLRLQWIKDEREKLSTEIYKLQREIIPMTGIRGSYIHTKDLHTILPEKGVEF